MLMNIFFSIDIILIIRYPFQTPNSRFTYYLLVSLLVSGIWSSALVHNYHFVEREGLYHIFNKISIMLVLVFQILIGIFSIIFALIKLCKPGISQELRHIVVKRHIVTVKIFILSNMYLTLGMIFVSYDGSSKWEHFENNTYNFYFIEFLRVIFFSQGILNALVRLSEPFFYKIIMRRVRAYFALNSDDKRLAQEQADDKTFLNRGFEEVDESLSLRSSALGQIERSIVE